MANPNRSPRFSSALVTESELGEAPDAARAAQLLSDRITAALGPEPIDLLIWFAAGRVAADAEAIAAAISAQLSPGTAIAATAHAVLHDAHELEGASAISALAARLPGARLSPFRLQAQNLADWALLINDEDLFLEAIGNPIDPRVFLMFAEPTTAPIDLGGSRSISILQAFNQFLPDVPVVGGVASHGVEPRANRLVLNDATFTAGVVGVAICGDIEVDIVTSQGCRPIGPLFTVSAAQENMISGLDGERPLGLVQQMVDDLNEEERRLLHSGGLYVGRAVQMRYDPGRGDFLVRGVLGVDSRTGALMIGDVVEPGDRLQFMVRDGRTAIEDLELCLVPHTFADAPAAALVFTCNGRGATMFGRPHVDVGAVQSLLAADDSTIPLAGFFCAGEIAPIGRRSYLHTHTASIALFRAPQE
jgi:small ligand-binding sensory domain FIST